MTLDTIEGVAVLALCTIVIIVLINILIAVHRQTRTMQSIEKTFSDFAAEEHDKKERKK